MILATDVCYKYNTAYTAGILFNDWEDQIPFEEKFIELPVPGKYIPGQFYKKELPCILKLLKVNQIHPEIIIIDGYVWLGKEQRKGLGYYLYDTLNEKSAVIGVAKTSFKDAPEFLKLYRGKSRRPLFITCIGIDQEEAKVLISRMYGRDRIPYLLKRVDHLSRRIC